MKISFIVPVYNAERYLSRCIKSVLAINSCEIELILVNDGSKDKSEVICTRFVHCDSRVKLITQKNAGVSAARNTGIAAAQGEYCFFLDADDYLIEDNIGLLLEEANSGKDIICFNHICVYENGYRKEELYSCSDKDWESLLSIKKQLLTTHMLHTCWGKLFKKSLIAEHHIQFPVGIKVGEDYLFVLEYCKYIRTGKIINKPIVYYCINSASVMQNYNQDERLQTWRKLMAITEKYYKDCGDEFDHEFYLYQFKTFTSMTRNVFLSSPKKEVVQYLKEIQREDRIQYIVQNINDAQVSVVKRIELWLTKGKKWKMFSCYFSMKAIIQRIRRDV